MNIPALYPSWILWIGDGTGLPDAILHIRAGLAILLIVRLLVRRSLATFIPFGMVVLDELGNEVMDYLAYGMREKTCCSTSPTRCSGRWSAA